MIFYRQHLYTQDLDSTEHLIDSIFYSQQNLSLEQKTIYYDIKMNISVHLKRPIRIILAYSDTLVSLIGDRMNESKVLREYYTDALFTKGEIYKNLGNYRLAYYYFLQAKRSGKTYNDGSNTENCINADFLYRIGMVYYRQERYRDATNSFIQSYHMQLQCDPNMPSLFRTEELLNNIGLGYNKLKQYDSALYYLDTALRYAINLNERYKGRYSISNNALGVVRGNRGQVYYSLGDEQHAIEDLEYNIAVNSRKNGDIQDAVTSVVFLAKIYLQTGKYDQGRTYMEMAQRITDSLPDVAIQRKIYQLKWKYFERISQKDSALVYAGKYVLLNDSLQAVDRAIQNIDVQATIDELEREFEVNLLRESAKKSNNIIYLTAVVAVLAILIVIVLLVNRRNTVFVNKQLTKLNTEVTHKNEQLESALRELKRLTQDKDRVMRIVAHDLRNPISAVYSMNEMMIESTTDDQTEQHEFLKMIKTACNSSIELINEILLMAEMSGDNVELIKEDVDINDFLSTAISLISFRAEEKRQIIEPDLLVISKVMHVAPEKFLRVISNLITNAIKFSPEGATIRVSAEIQNEHLLISVQDHGIGIPKHLQEKVFDVFTEAKRVGTSGEKPFGLGLSIVKQLVEAHQGKIWFKSKEGKGTTFFIELPL